MKEQDLIEADLILIVAGVSGISWTAVPVSWRTYRYNPRQDYKLLIVCKMVPYVVVAYFMVFSCLVFGYVCRGSLLDVAIFTPIASMPCWAQYVTYANPMRCFADAMRGIFLKGCTLADIWKDRADGN